MLGKLGRLLALAVTLLVPCSAGEKSPQYRDYPVTNVFKSQPATVKLGSNPKARQFRTQLRKQAAQGPNFAGHYRIAVWGCGSSCQQFAIIDCKTGHVYFSPQLPYVTYVHWNGDDPGLQFRIDSRLLILNCSPQEEETNGSFYYLWTTNQLQLIRSLPRR